jgi:hypothetical protein
MIKMRSILLAISANGARLSSTIKKSISTYIANGNVPIVNKSDKQMTISVSVRFALFVVSLLRSVFLKSLKIF